MNDTSSPLQTLNTDEIEQVSGGFTTGSLLEDMKLTGGSFRPLTWFDLLGTGKQIYIDGVPIDTKGMLGPRP
jgi:hypothetical protein